TLSDSRLSANVLLLANGQFALNGNESISGNLGFGAQARQMLNLWSTTHGIGVQNNTTYFRSGSEFSWFKAGVHSDVQNDPGSGGSRLMLLQGTGELHVGGGVFAGLSLQNRETPGYVASPGSGERWVCYVSQGSCRFWSGNDKLTVTTSGAVTATSFNPTSDRHAKAG